MDRYQIWIQSKMFGVSWKRIYVSAPCIQEIRWRYFLFYLNCRTYDRTATLEIWLHQCRNLLILFEAIGVDRLSTESSNCLLFDQTLVSLQWCEPPIAVWPCYCDFFWRVAVFSWLLELDSFQEYVGNLRSSNNWWRIIKELIFSF